MALPRSLSRSSSLCTLLLFGATAFAQSPIPVQHGADPAYRDTTCAPCQNFYQYANGGWTSKTVLPKGDDSKGTLDEMNERAQTVLHAILDSLAATNLPPGSAEWKLGHFYASCMDSARAEREGAAPVRDELRRIDSIANPGDLQREVARLQRMRIGPPVFFFTAEPDPEHSTAMIASASQSGLGMADRDDYFRRDDESERSRRDHVGEVAHFLELSGITPADARAKAARVMSLETALASATMTAEERRNPSALVHRLTLSQLAQLTPHWSWPDYFREMGRADLKLVNVDNPRFFSAFDGLILSLPLDDWKSYLRSLYMETAASRLGTAYQTQSPTPRWQRCLGQTNVRLGFALGRLYAARAFAPAAKQTALEMVRQIKSVYRERLASASWMSETARREAVKKLDGFEVKIGYPDHWRDYSALVVRDGSYWANVVAANEFETARLLAQIGRPVDPDEWWPGYWPQTVDAYFDQNHNKVVLPAGNFQAPNFDLAADDGSNYGAIGAVIAHELTHGFDDRGRQFDAAGNLRDWWTAGDNDEYSRRAQLVVKQYDDYVAIDSLHVNGKLTLSEDIADIVGLQMSYAALERALEGKPRALIQGMTPEQRFFLAWAQSRRGIFSPDYIRMKVEMNPHAPENWRVMGPIANMPEFARAFGCSAEDPMVRSDAVLVRFW
jgi:putative endopeptidase